MDKTRPYHHGNLAQAVLDAAVEAVTESGPEKLSMRDLARRAGVSHAAPAHHFGDKAGLLTAVATQGFDLLADALVAEQQRTGDFLEVGVAYVRFAVEHRAHFEVMFRPELYNPVDAGVEAARQRATEALYGGVESVPDEQRGDRDVQKDGVAAWSLVHGFATLWLNNAFPQWLGDDPEAAVRATAGLLFSSRGAAPTSDN